MKKIMPHVLLASLLIMTLLASACSRSEATSSLSGAAFTAQVTPQPPGEDRSEIGSTDGIFIMGIVIVALTSIPVWLWGGKKKDDFKND